MTSHSHVHAPARWIERLVAMGAGSLLTWWCVDVPRADRGDDDDRAIARPLEPGEPGEPSEPLEPGEPGEPSPTAGSDGAAAIVDGAGPRASDSLPRGDEVVGSLATAARPADEAAAAGELVARVDRTATAAEASAMIDGSPAPSAAPAAATEAPALPLPRMPGATRLSESVRYDEVAGAWVRKAAFRVHAREHHVLAFYRKALENEGLVVTEGEDPPDEAGGVRRYLHGRSRRVTAQVGVRTRVGALETRVWILWRARS
ncbi:MAG: hypothetical protein IPH07_06050 [Deltaproteobacteria bacterium]|nr:hypothetical protein [Deltaproteobacteria bacterium]MBK8719969.1 hypothetical protein [Deltaproteobacteria bacterium]MBP7290917.1 hypothetical protein [Nannocystaceae bacterium]